MPSKSKHRAEMRRWRDRNPQRQRLHSAASNLKRQFGLTLAQYHALLLAQNNACAICKTTDPGKTTRPKKLKSGVSTLPLELPTQDAKRLFFCVDHDHETKRVRKLLCHHCNSGLGHFRDNPALLRAAADYLESYK